MIITGKDGAIYTLWLSSQGNSILDYCQFVFAQ
jgi:hypothetical protein